MTVSAGKHTFHLHSSQTVAGFGVDFHLKST